MARCGASVVNFWRVARSEGGEEVKSKRYIKRGDSDEDDDGDVE